MTTRSLITIAVDNSANHSDQSIKELIHRIPGTHMLDSAELNADLTDFEWDDEEGLPQLPLSAEDVRGLMNEDGQITVVVAVNKDEYFEAVSKAATEGADTHEDLVHGELFDFGLPYDCTTKVLAVQGDDFIVSYTTRISEFI